MYVRSQFPGEAKLAKQSNLRFAQFRLDEFVCIHFIPCNYEAFAMHVFRLLHEGKFVDPRVEFSGQI